MLILSINSMFAVGDLIYSQDINCWGNHSKYIHFGKVTKITKTGMFSVNILEKIPHIENEQTMSDNYEKHTVVTPGTHIIDHITLNQQGVVRGKKFGTGDYVKFEKYTPTLTLIEEIDLIGQ
jgi:hypothetical protein